MHQTKYGSNVIMTSVSRGNIDKQIKTEELPPDMKYSHQLHSITLTFHKLVRQQI